MSNTPNTKNLMGVGLLAFATFALFACGGGQGGDGAGTPEEVGTTEFPTAAAPRQAEQPGVTAEQPAAPDQQQPGQQPASPGVPVGYQAVQDTPVATIEPHPGHELLITQVAASPAPAPAPGFTKEWFVSPSGNDSGDGSQQQPFKTLARGVQAVGPGEVLRVQGGSYPETVTLAGKDGRPDAKIIIQGEGKPKIHGNGQNPGVVFKAKHWVVDGFDIDLQNRAEFAVTFEGNTEGSTLANSEVHNGTAGAGVNVHTHSNGAIIENNNIHHFSRGNDDSHGVVVQTTTHNTTIRNNDIHDVSGDSVQCLGPEGFNSNPPADGVVIENNHFYSAQENGVDIKTCHNVTIRNNRMHTFRAAPSGQGAKGDAIVIHMSAKNVTVEGNELFDAGKGIALGGNRQGGPMPSGVIVRRNTIHDIKKDAIMEGAGMRIENSEGAQVLNNVFWNLQGSGLIIGHGTNGPTSNLTVKNNVIGGTGLALKVGSQAPGLKMDGNLYAPGTQISNNGATVSFAQWQQAGQDANSASADPGFSGTTFTPGPAAIDKGQNVGLSFCGAAPDIGANETAC